MSFSPWFPLSAQGIDQHAPQSAAAVQVKREAGLVTYPSGKSAMLFYFYADRSSSEALHSLFPDEVAYPGTRGHGPLRFRIWEGDEARGALESLFHEFSARFGAAPVLHDSKPTHEDQDQNITRDDVQTADNQTNDKDDEQ